MMYKVYMHITPNGKKYIGTTKNSLCRRWENGKGYRKNKLFYDDIIKYGWNKIKHILLFDNLTEKEAREKEIELIKKYKTTNKKYGYNKTKGGDIRKQPTLETRLKISNTLKNKNKGRNYNLFSNEIIHKKGKPVMCIETNKVFPRIKDASIYYNICDETIRKCCHKKRFTAGGYHWCFYEEANK